VGSDELTAFGTRYIRSLRTMCGLLSPSLPQASAGQLALALALLAGYGAQACGARETGSTNANVDAGATANAPSCSAAGAGVGDCGPARESCCTSLEVTGGTFIFSDYNTNPSGTAVSVSSFRLDKYAVSVGRFRQFVSAWNAGWMPAPGSGKHTHLNGGLGLVNSAPEGGYEYGWLAADNSRLSLTDANLGSCVGGRSYTDTFPYSTWTSSPGTQENLPINCVNWWEACAFCIWDGGFLPSQVEYEYAATGGSQQRPYPWGSTDPGATNQYAIYNCYYGSAGCTGIVSIAPVGTAVNGVARWGQLDLTGNLSQWNLDAYGPVSCTDCAFLLPSGGEIIRGGSFVSSFLMVLLSNYRGAERPWSRLYGVGFRCARFP
jgi:formylglycine-generating enzyme required for sulfatase activity